MTRTVWRRARTVAALATLLLPVGLPALSARALAAPRATVPATITVTGVGGSVVVGTSPYHLAVLDTAGRTVVSEVPGGATSPTPYADEDPPPLGSTVRLSNALVAPLVITVGQTAQPAYPGTPFAGNLIAGASTGVQYAATAVTASRADGAGGLAMTVRTTDPAGRTIALDVRPDGTGFRVDAQVQGAPDLSVGAEGAKGTLLGDSFTAPEGEAFHGFGGRHESTDLRGTIFDEWLSEEDFGAGPAQPAAGTSSGSGDAYLFPSGSAAAYYVQSAFVSQHYGFLLDQDEISHWQLAPPSTPDVWQVTAGADHLDALVLPGDPAASIPALTERTGRQRVPPRVGAAAAARPPRLRR